MIRVYKDDAAWITENGEANGVSVAEAFRRLRQRRGERPVLVDVAAVAPSTSGPTLTPAREARARRCSCATPVLSKSVTSLCTACGSMR